VIHSLEQSKQAIRDVSEREDYLDVHEWCFTPTSFRLMMRDLFELGFIQLKELPFYPTKGSESYIALSPSGELPGGTRLEWLQQVDREQSLS
jgi:hypothetical protein